MPRVLFINGGILGLSSFHRFLVEYLPCQSKIDGTHVVLTEDLTLFDRVVRRAAAIIATSRWAANALHARYPDCDTPMHVLPNPVLLQHFDRSWIEQRRARAGAKPRVLFVGGDFPRKGGFDLLDAWKAGNFPSVATLDMVTNCDLPERLPEGVNVWRGVDAHSHEWRARWEQADVFVMPTRNEAFGLVYQEAAAAGLPAIGTAQNAVPEIVRDGETGILVRPGDIAALVGAMHALLDSAELRDRMGSRARQLIETAASPEAYMERLTAIIMEAAGSRTL